MNEDVFPIENGDFPVRHVSFFRGVTLGIWILVCNHHLLVVGLNSARKL